MKRVLSVLFSIIIVSFSALCLRPFSIYADNEPISGFDYTNYYQLEYIQSSGRNWINTEYALWSTNTWKIEYKFTQSENYSYNNHFGVHGSDSTTNEIWSGQDGIYNVRLGGVSRQNIKTLSLNTDYTFILENTSGTLKVYVNGILEKTINGVNTNESRTLDFMHRYDATYLHGKVYYLKFWNSNGSLVRNFVPAERKSDNVLGLYDTVSSTFFTNSGSGSFTGGNRVNIPVIQQYTISTAVSPSGSGTVSGGGTYDSGTIISLTATASSGYSFSEWSDGNTSNPRSVTVSSNETYTAFFTQNQIPVTQYTITTSVSPSGSGTVTVGGTYDSGTIVVLTATPSNGYQFTKWSDDVTSNPRSITVSSNGSYTALFDLVSVEPEPEVPSGWTDWTDEYDSKYYEEVTSSLDLSKLKWTIYKTRVIDYVVLFGDQYQINSGLNGSNLNHIYFTGSYYDNSITALTGCNSSSYNYQTQSVTQTDVLTIEPAIYGQFDAPSIGEDGTMFNFGVSVNAGASSNITATNNSFSNQTEACRLIGMGQGDGSVDGTTLLALGYQKKTITYNDGSTNGHTATVYVPGDEQFEFAADLSFLDDLMEQLYINVVSNLHAWGHDEYTLQMQPEVGYYVPDTGYLWSKAFIGSLLEKVQFTTTSPIQNTNKTFYIVPQENTSANIDYQGKFDYSIQDNEYYLNRTYLYWKGTTKPKWVFRTNTIDMSSYQDTWGNNMYVWDTYGRSMSYTSSHTVTSSDVGHDSNLTLGALMYTGIENIHFYELKNNSILNRFNQLGSMIYGWFNRIYQAIGNITGGNESNDIINNVVNDYDLDVETNFNGLLNNLENYKDDIDLTLPEFVIPSSDVDGIESLSGAFKQMYEDVYVDNGLGILIYVPLILLALRLIL